MAQQRRGEGASRRAAPAGPAGATAAEEASSPPPLPAVSPAATPSAVPEVLLQTLSEAEDLAARAGLTFEFFSRRYVARLSFSIVFFLLAAYLNTLASVCAGHRTPWLLIKDLDGKVTTKNTLPDLGHDAWEWLLEYSSSLRRSGLLDNYNVPDILVSQLAVFTWLFVASHPQRFMVLRRILVLTGIMMVLRSITVSVTQLPDAAPTCQAQFEDPHRGLYKRSPMFPRSWHRAWIFMLEPTSHVTCGDMVFSMHTTFLIMSACVFKHYCKAKHLQTKIFLRSFHTPEWCCRLLRWTIYIYVMVGCALIIGTRLHYTLDVLVAAFGTYSIFTYYHSWLRYKRLTDKGWSVLGWFEAEEIMSLEAWAYDRAKGKN